MVSSLDFSRHLLEGLTSASSRFCLKARDAASAATCQADPSCHSQTLHLQSLRVNAANTIKQYQTYQHNSTIFNIYQQLSTSSICMRNALGLCQFNGMLLTCLAKTGLRCSRVGHLGHCSSQLRQSATTLRRSWRLVPIKLWTSFVRST